MDGNLIGVFGTNTNAKSKLIASIAKRSETEGIVVYSRVEAGKRFSFLDDTGFPDKIQGYARMASICDHAYYIYPTSGKLTSPDGELAVLLDAFRLEGSVQLIDASSLAFSEVIRNSFKGLVLSSFPIVERASSASLVDLSSIHDRASLPKGKTLIYIDRAFTVKGVGTVVLGFVLSGGVSIHDKLRLIPSESGKLAEVKGIQVSDEDFDTVGRGIRVGLSLKGVEVKDLEKTSWLDDGSIELSNEIEFEFGQTPYYKQPSLDRDLHFEVNGEMLPGRIIQGTNSSRRIAKLGQSVPVWPGMSLAVFDLNSRTIRVVGAGSMV
ncbi:MAG: hypothetical protein JRN20_20015 [Nitrososphaerota archaeon]|nr:hypothetical protein [Nitrososphaerota archaeon]